MATQPAPSVQQPTKKPLIRRFGHDKSQRIRHIVQGLFLLLNGWLGIQFYLWARFYERGGAGFSVSRPAGVEGWLPIAGLMNTKYLLLTGRVPAIHPAAMYLFIGFMLMSILLKKAFCSWLCPVGTFSEFLWRIGHRFFGRNLRLPKWFDIPLRSLKYILLALFVAVIGVMSAEALDGFMQTPYGLLVDVKMMNFFRDMGITAAVVIGLLILLSTLVQNFWCRYLCPYGALMGLASLLSPVKIRRDEQSCIDCSKCSKACPAGLAVDQLVQIRTVECTACMACVSVCPAQDALQFALPPRKAPTAAARWQFRSMTPLAVTAVLAYIFFGVVLLARATNHWQTNLPEQVYMHLVPRANQLTHPGM
ncbi:4Fe-4S binding protein [Occallatibacter savannae]|uniref:4Fe-4S binding protein n=1 Tax=Occallatibacter savannae TaxID=1002691 RepID=UPI000D68FD6E|nr:4Fe-4S binding protein [Occallatibacter savannae]